MNGGIPKHNIVLISGGAGTGKTTFCIQFLISGAREKKKGLFISTEQNEENILKHSQHIAEDISKLIQEKLIKIIFINILEEKDTTYKILEIINEFSPDRIAIDSLTTFSEYISLGDYAKESFLRNTMVNRDVIQKFVPLQVTEKTIIKRILAKLLVEIRKVNATVLLTSELPEKGDSLSSDGISEFLADGVILLKSLAVGDSLTRTLEIKKMRYSNIKGGIKTYELNESGLEVKQQ